MGVYGVDAENHVAIPTIWTELGVIQGAATPFRRCLHRPFPAGLGADSGHGRRFGYAGHRGEVQSRGGNQRSTDNGRRDCPG